MKCVGIEGSRSLPDNFRFHVREVVSHLLAKGCYINSGGAMGADSYVIAALLRYGKAYRGVIYSAWSYFSGFPYSVRQEIGEFAKRGGRIDWGTVQPDPMGKEVIAGLLGRNRKLVQNSDALIAYFYGESRGTIYTIREARKKNLPIIVFVCDPVSSRLYQNLDRQIGGQIKIFEISTQSMPDKLFV
ncbi:DNA-processing protein DprA [Candidatus Saganbacteria bacterium]|nr:DNA-processing protein DprA [Candidatus Saganbacteria bacterium]